ncbi:glycosyltransferase family 2 protein [Sphaerochaeta globosa]|uniref:Glycosyl transferase family 2 n=1 Tax=Sphaerochaeta globosa (strain ATCC BAA-1886 / DSM 22777 / Buddy) TaxID=158189 RepID=F0RXQ6_SPHGB|nr:glycosyltransferase family 2 protein [Sphaerochaeta globosa]ADY12106.1 glycosyl transferase family 2 [Sphaerochaeta globosa str. Buddy]
MKDLISIIVPIYKVEKYLEKCISSIQTQLYSNIEIILVDDGSPDRCGQICDEYAKKDKRIIVVHQVNGGLSNARNSGIRVAKGVFLVFVDSDDWIENDYVLKLYFSAIETNADLTICGIRYVDEDGLTLKTVLPGKEGSFSNSDIIRSMYGRNRTPYVTAWTKLYKKDLFDKVLFPDGKIHEDEYTFYQYIYYSKVISIVNEPLYNTTVREGSITTSKYSIRRLDCIEALFYRIEFYTRISDIEDQVRFIIKEFYGAYAFGLSRIKPINESECNRVIEVKSMAKQILHLHSKEMGVKGRIAVFSPKLYMLILKLGNIHHKYTILRITT